MYFWKCYKCGIKVEQLDDTWHLNYQTPCYSIKTLPEWSLFTGALGEVGFFQYGNCPGGNEFSKENNEPFT